MKFRKANSLAQGNRAREEVGLNLGLHSPLLYAASIGHGLTMTFIGLLNNQGKMMSIMPIGQEIHRK